MIKKTKYLSQKERETARKYYFRFASFNGIGFSFLGNTTVYLLAILYGATNTQLGYISAAAYITGGLLILYPRLFRGKSNKMVGYIAWQLRGIICLAYLALPFLSGPPAIYLILTTYTMFCMVRTIGVAVQQTIQKMVSTSRTRGEVIMTLSSRFNTMALLSRFFSFVWTSLTFLSELTGILSLQMLGIVMNIMASLNLKKIPNREVVDYIPGEHMGKIFVKAMKQKKDRSILILRWSAISIEIIAAMTIPFLRQYAGFSTSQIFMYTLIITTSSIFAALLIRPFADRLGSRPFILPAAITAGIIFSTWMGIQPDRSPEFFYILGFLTVFIQNILSLLSARLFVQTIPDEGTISFTSMDIVVTSFLALLLGFLAGGLADLSSTAGNLPYINIYGLTFSLGLLFSILIAITAARFSEEGSTTVRKTWAMIFSLEHMRTFRDITRLNNGNSNLKRKTLILSLAYTGSSLANDEIRQMFLNPLSSEKSDIMKTLFDKKRPELVPELIREAQNVYSLSRNAAIFALGSYPMDAVEKALIELLDDPDPITASTAAKSLGRIGNTEKTDLIFQKFIQGKRGNIHSDLNYIIALHNMDPQGPWLEETFSREQAELGESYEQSVITLICRQQNLSPPIAWIYQMNNQESGEGLHILLDETREMDIFFQARDHMDSSFSKGKYSEIWTWCRKQLSEERRVEGAAIPVVRSIQSFDLNFTDPTNTIAALYYTYQILRKGGEL